mgnify:CR=1 FL=1
MLLAIKEESSSGCFLSSYSHRAGFSTKLRYFTWFGLYRCDMITWPLELETDCSMNSWNFENQSLFPPEISWWSMSDKYLSTPQPLQLKQNCLITATESDAGWVNRRFDGAFHPVKFMTNRRNEKKYKENEKGFAGICSSNSFSIKAKTLICDDHAFTWMNWKQSACRVPCNLSWMRR